MISPCTVSDPAPPIRVCLLIDNLNRAGTELQLLMLLSGLNLKRVEPYLVLLDGTDNVSRLLEPSNCVLLRLGIKSILRPSTISTLWQFVGFLRRKKIDILQLYFRDSTYFGILAGKLAGVRRIVLTRRNIGHWMTLLDRLLMRLCQHRITCHDHELRNVSPGSHSSGECAA